MDTGVEYRYRESIEKLLRLITFVGIVNLRNNSAKKRVCACIISCRSFEQQLLNYRTWWDNHHGSSTREHYIY